MCIFTKVYKYYTEHYPKRITLLIFNKLKTKIMNYYISKLLLSTTFPEAIEQVTAELSKEGFGIMTEVDVKATLKEKINVDFKKYTILGACNPVSAYEALQVEDKIGVLLPCNVIVVEHENGGVEVSAVDPIASMTAVDNEAVACISSEVRKKLQRVIDRLK